MVYLRKILPLLAVLALTDAHWGIMQVATWVEMTIDSASKNESILTSIQQTVTGEKKCPRCCQLEEDRKRDNDRTIQWETKSLGLNAIEKKTLIPPTPVYACVTFDHQVAKSRREAPIPPPPWS